MHGYLDPHLEMHSVSLRKPLLFRCPSANGVWNARLVEHGTRLKHAQAPRLFYLFVAPPSLSQLLGCLFRQSASHHVQLRVDMHMLKTCLGISNPLKHEDAH